MKKEFEMIPRSLKNIFFYMIQGNLGNSIKHVYLMNKNFDK